MLKLILIVFVSRLMEIVHVQLTDEGGKIIMFKVLRKNILTKIIDFLDYKSSSITTPTYNILI